MPKIYYFGGNTMKKIQFFSILICLILFSAFTQGCYPNENYYIRDISVAVIGGKHANLGKIEIPKIDFIDNEDEDDDSFLTTRDRVKNYFGMIADSNPTKIDLQNAEEYEETIENGRWDTIQKDVINFIIEMQDKEADDEEVDTLKALCNVAKVFNQQTRNKNRLLIYDSGLCTSGALNFIEKTNLKKLIDKNKAITKKEVSSVVKELNKNKDLPKFSNTKILWYGIGMTGGKQSELSNLQISNLQTIWNEILCESGAEVNFIDVINNQEKINDKSLPSVSVVMFDNAVQLGEDELGFESGSAEFREGTEENRIKVLKKFVNEAKSNRILIVGTTSSGGSQKPDDEDFKLSWDRAEAVQNELEKFEIPEYQIETLGLGTQSHKYNPDEFVNGKYITDSSAAKENRSVYIMLANSREANEFRKDQSEFKKWNKLGIKTSR